MEVTPDWWKKLPKNYYEVGNFFPEATMKTCVGMYDMYAKSVAMPLWSELCINVTNGAYGWQFADRMSTAEVHPHYQYGEFLDNTYGHLKVLSPWFCETKGNIDWIMTKPVYNNLGFRDYTLAQGLLNFSKRNATNLQFIVDLSYDKVFTIPFGAPILLTPLSDKQVVIHRHLVSAEKIHSIQQKSLPSTFVNSFKVHERVAKCPFKDGYK
jgi:hypothetical protein